jgi:uncharacterized protein YraI
MTTNRSLAIIASGALALSAMLVASVVEAQQAFVSHRTTLRAGPDRAYPQVAWVSAGTGVYVNGCVNGYHWCDVSAAGTRGWVNARHLTYSYQNRRTMIYGNGLAFGAPVVGFGVGSYWGSYYRDRPWYRHHNYWDGWRPGMAAPRAEFHRAAPVYVAPRPHYVAPPRVHREIHPSHRERNAHQHRNEPRPHRGNNYRAHDPSRSAGPAAFVGPR